MPRTQTLEWTFGIRQAVKQATAVTWQLFGWCNASRTKPGRNFGLNRCMKQTTVVTWQLFGWGKVCANYCRFMGVRSTKALTGTTTDSFAVVEDMEKTEKRIRPLSMVFCRAPHATESTNLRLVSCSWNLCRFSTTAYVNKEKWPTVPGTSTGLGPTSIFSP
jgi:hypothetical protein